MKSNRTIQALALTAAFTAGALISGVVRGDQDAAPVRVTGIGGVFFKSENPDALKAWYQKHLGLKTDKWGTNFEWRQGDDPSKYGFTQWSPFKSTTSYFAPSEKDFMINYRVTDLTALVAQLETADVVITDTIESYEYGKFVHIMDLEGNKIELWEPVDTAYDKIVEGRTK